MYSKKYLLIIFLLFLRVFHSNLSAQDLIVKQNGDSLNVEIIRVTADHILYIYQNGKQIKRVKSPKSEIKSFRYIFFSEKRKLAYKFDPNDFRFRLAVSGGVSLLLDGADEDASAFFSDYVDKLNSGWHFKAEANYFLRSGLGFGIVFDQYHTSGNNDNVIFVDRQTNDTTIGPLSDKIKITYIGPQLTYHIKSGLKNTTFYVGGGAGVNLYRDELERVDAFVAKGTAFGLHGSLGVDFLVDENIMVGFELSGHTGNLRDFTLAGDDGVRDFTNEDNDISRISLSFGVRFIK